MVVTLLPLGWLLPWLAEPYRYAGGVLIREHMLRHQLLMGFAYSARQFASDVWIVPGLGAPGPASERREPPTTPAASARS